MEGYMTFNRIVITFLFLLTLPITASAINQTYSDMFDGTEPRIAGLPGNCGTTVPLAYKMYTFESIVDGTWSFSDAYLVSGVNVNALIYNGVFDPESPQTGLMTPNGINFFDTVQLSPGEYTLVIQQQCENQEGAWAVTSSGPDDLYNIEYWIDREFADGEFTSSDPVVTSDCGTSQYVESGAIQVSRSGTYYYTDISIDFDVDMCLQVYSAPFDPDNPSANRVGASMDDYDEVDLLAGQDYYLVAQPLIGSTNGEYFFVLAQPAPFRITKALSGSWFNPETPGQGFFIDVLDDINLIFLAWFTYDLERPDAQTPSGIGEAGHRWMTAYGYFAEDSVTLDIEWSSGMVFDSGNPAVEQKTDGSMTLKFENCTAGTVDYDLGSVNRRGIVSISAGATDMAEWCEKSLKGPGSPTY
jgi:hypothetical protein